MSEIRVLPLPKVTGIWKHDFSKYPDAVRVSMSDGKVLKYVLDVEQPAPVLRGKLDRFRELCIGYEKPADVPASNRPKTGDMSRVHSITKGEKRK